MSPPVSPGTFRFRNDTPARWAALTMPAPRVRPLVLSALLAAISVAGKAEADPDAHPAGGELAIVSDSNCPSAEAVREALVDLRPVGQWPALSVAIRATPEMLVVEIGPEKTNSRQLTVGPDCAARATAVALVFYTWTGDLPVEAEGTPILQPATPIPQPATPILQPTAPVPQPAAPILQPSSGKQPEKPILKGNACQSEIGAGLLAATAGGIVPGGRVEFGRMRRGSGFGWQVDFTVPAARQVNIGGGTTRWMRISAGVGIDARWALRRFFLDGELGGVAGLTFAWGQGYATNQSDWSPTWGLGAGIRAGVPWGRTRLWLDLRAVKWLREQSVRIDPVTTGTPIAANLPSWDAQGAIGISYIFQ